MVTLVYGGSGSGKSEFAEDLVMSGAEPGHRYYIATMIAAGEEGRRRVERHVKLRSGKGFQTIECPRNIEEALRRIPRPEEAVLLIECVSYLVANEMFDSDPAGGSPDGKIPQVVKKVISGIEGLTQQVRDAVLVSNNIFDDGMEYDHLTVAYAKALGMVNWQLAADSDRVFEVTAGIPQQIR